jgi:hypothetical protein
MLIPFKLNLKNGESENFQSLHSEKKCRLWSVCKKLNPPRLFTRAVGLCLPFTIALGLIDLAAAESQPDAPSPDELVKQLSNPVASLISVPFQNNFDFGLGAGEGWRYTLNFQPVVPLHLNDNWNLIVRTIVPFIHQEDLLKGLLNEIILPDDEIERLR